MYIYKPIRDLLTIGTGSNKGAINRRSRIIPAVFTSEATLIKIQFTYLQNIVIVQNSVCCLKKKFLHSISIIL